MKTAKLYIKYNIALNENEVDLGFYNFQSWPFFKKTERIGKSEISQVQSPTRVVGVEGSPSVLI